ncbi:DUF1499 domain-containing protein [Aliiroseovarius crassostreae]|uniref:DUF1499 domain-containing protein n=1 Tax=Aliiroseovarius crassostreae TaxID=154981 RepID=UPI0021FEF943|nr:DUF1499 domain-containing protein [Aliiroseovarius crassostreae]UWP87802.1 DUF1499 domain-containing protein [Aliiroseovarius crassostreae]UWQ00422.1 DUF1499 domain-containing protein [Aliiroseovarius crassostreae]
MQTGIWLLAGLVALAMLGVVALAGYSRWAPLPTGRLADHPGPQPRGQHTLEGGVKYVLPLGQLPQGGVARLLDLVRKTPRTEERPAADGYSFVHRSRLFGFPDITRIWVADGHLHIHSHLVIGRSDLGVNAARLSNWLKLLYAQPGREAGAARVAPDRDIQAHVA